MEPAFYHRDPRTVARELLGCRLVKGDCVGRIVETEAYAGADDPASHASNGRTERNQPMYGPAGRAYVYVCYGIHRMMNATTGRDGRPGAVLLRAVEPIDGIDTMRSRRNVDDPASLCDGPGKLCEAFEISLADNGSPLTNGPIRIDPGEPPHAVSRTPRVGVTGGTEREWRFVVEGSEYVS